MEIKNCERLTKKLQIIHVADKIFINTPSIQQFILFLKYAEKKKTDFIWETYNKPNKVGSGYMGLMFLTLISFQWFHHWK